MTQKVDASPTKEFFVKMITKDISLRDCILDLLDNSVDGARSVLYNKAREQNQAFDTTRPDFTDFYAKIEITNEAISIKDNCGGISIEVAKNYAFHFGRRKDAPLTEGNIGLYGIGMKRAVLKMGEKITIASSTEDEAFSVDINVPQWLEDDKWDFVLKEKKVFRQPGTRISVTSLYENIKKSFADNAFRADLIRAISRNYSFIISSGFKIYVNNREIQRYHFEIKESKDIIPARIIYGDKYNGKKTGVTVEIIAGMANLPPDEPTAEELVSQSPTETESYGWFVICNDRVVLAADKTNLTVWGKDGIASWHPQFNGFLGIVRFNSIDPSVLPWTTTKRSIDESSPIYRRALIRMKEVTRSWINYTTQRKKNLNQAKLAESVAEIKPVENVQQMDRFVLPKIDNAPRIRMATINYQKPESEVVKAKVILGNRSLSNSEIGRLTFDYFLQQNTED